MGSGTTFGDPIFEDQYQLLQQQREEVETAAADIPKTATVLTAVVTKVTTTALHHGIIQNVTQ